jgi:hypothetical protein
MKAHSSIRRHAITGKSRLRQSWVMTHSNSGTETAKLAFSIECSAAIFMRERHNRNYPIPESIRLQNAFWAWERATWIVLAVILLIASPDCWRTGRSARAR